MKKYKAGGGWPAVFYTWQKAREAGGILKLWRAMRSKNACKTCALGMGGQRGGMVNELGHFPEVCKKSLQAMVADMQGAVRHEFWQKYTPRELQQLSPRELEACGRLVEPVVYTRETGRYTPITWDDAIGRIVAKLRATSPDETFWYFSGRSSNEAGFLLQLFARLYGTNNVNNCSFYCHQASGVGLASVTGSGTATIQLEDLDQADTVFLIGGNPASNHPRLMRTLLHVRRRGGEVIVINPLVETGLVRFNVPSDIKSLLFRSKIASLYIQPHIGGDLALLTGLAKRIVEMNAHDVAFLTDHCQGWPELKARLAEVSWDEIVTKSGVSRQDIDAIATRYAASKNVVFSWTMGITHHTHGVKNVQAIANLALLRGMAGRPGCGLMPIRGHSNVQGIGSVGVMPKLKDAIFDRLQTHFGVELPTTPGRDTMACMEGATAGELKVGFCLGGNLYGSNPDATYAGRSIANLDQITYLSTTLNTGHAFGLARETIILPVSARDEEPEPTTQESMFNYVRLSDGGPQRHAGTRSEIDVIASIASGVAASSVTGVAGSSNGVTNGKLGASVDGDHTRQRKSLTALDWNAMRSTSQIQQAIANIIPGFDKIADISSTKQEFQIGGRTFHTPQFATPDGRANIHTHDLPELAGTGPDEIRLMTIRSEGQFNTVVYEDEDVYRGIDRRDVILLHPDDLRRFGVKDGDRVTVHGPAGTMYHIRATAFDSLKPGNAAMYYPECNVLVSRALDPQSKTPAFKGVVVRVEAVPSNILNGDAGAVPQLARLSSRNS
ncbi:MAG TPA: molybdopterin-dependent oxidoreductase [Lacipirellulaceae bacterium]|jgi:molybdopterin-dependent oxidoreductase alpha subunit|nr:molybdopterin-dependent oxidoreductase [Lacipirellulaceae bacterium]